jgi:hypothetical protein
VPWGQWQRLTVLGALGLEGVVASMSIAAATTGAVFLAFLEQVLIPVLRGRPDAILVMDNLGAHKAEQVRHALEAAKILAGPEPDRALLVQAQGAAAGQGGPHAGGARGRARPSAGHDLRPGRAGLVPPLRLLLSQLM